MKHTRVPHAGWLLTLALTLVIGLLPWMSGTALAYTTYTSTKAVDTDLKLYTGDIFKPGSGIKKDDSADNLYIYLVSMQNGQQKQETVFEDKSFTKPTYSITEKMMVSSFSYDDG